MTLFKQRIKILEIEEVGGDDFVAKKIFHLTFPKELIKEPIIYTMAKEYDVIPNIRRAKVTEDVGEIILELEAKEENLEKGINYFISRGVKVEPLAEEILE